MLSIFFKWKKIEFHEKCKNNTFNLWGKLMQVILVKTYIVCYRKMPKKQKFHHLFAEKTPFNVKQLPPPPPPPQKKKKKKKKKSNNFHAVPAASTAGPCPTIIGLSLWFSNNMQICRRNSNCVDPNQTNSFRAG